jgi:undecaprenyl-diphosphatase
VPATLSALGFETQEPSLLVSAVLHLGTLLAVLVYFRSDIARLLRFRQDAEGRRLWLLLVIGTIPALIGLPLEGALEHFQDDPRKIGLALMGTGVILFVGSRFASGTRKMLDMRPREAALVGVAQAVALIPGVSRSGSTITAGSILGLAPAEAARYSFLLGVPTIAGGGLLSLLDVGGSGGMDASMWVGVGLVVAAVSGYAAIALTLAALKRVGLLPFAVYALVAGLAAFLFL